MSAWTEEDNVRLLSMVISGYLTINEIAKLLDRSVDSVRKQLRARNLRVVTRPVPERHNIIEDYKNKLPLIEIAEKHNQSMKELKNVLLWGHENNLVDARKALNNKWKDGDILKMTRMHLLLDEKEIYKHFEKVFDVNGLIKSFWGIEPTYILGIEASEFVEMFNVLESDSFPIVTTVREVSKGRFLSIIPWVFIELYEAKNKDIEYASNKMATLQRMIYLETDREKILDKIINIIDKKYKEEDYSLMQ